MRIDPSGSPDADGAPHPNERPGVGERFEPLNRRPLGVPVLPGIRLGPAAPSLLWKLAGWGWMWGGGEMASGEPDLIDPHSARTIRLFAMMCVLGAVLLAIAGLFAFRWCTSTVSTRAIDRGHAEARAYRRAVQSRNRQKKAE